MPYEREKKAALENQPVVKLIVIAEQKLSTAIKYSSHTRSITL